MSDPLESEKLPSAPATLVLGDEALEAVRRAASSAFPREACGVLIGARDDLRARVVRARNGANLALDPMRSFDLDPALVVVAEDDARNEGLELLGVWHSHPNAPAELSASDRRADIPGRFSLVASFVGGRLRELRAWRRESGVWEPVRVERVSRTTLAPESRATRAR